jgi:prepilin peptidase CpaA
METSQIAVLILGAIACWCDLRTRHIPNLLTFGGAAIAVGYAFFAHGIGGGLTSVVGWFAGAAVFLPFFALGGMGAGDVKLMACVGAWLGPRSAFWAAIYAALAGGVMAIGMALATGYLRQARENLWLLLTHWRVVGIRPLPELTLEGSRGPRLPYAFPIMAGTVATIYFR